MTRSLAALLLAATIAALSLTLAAHGIDFANRAHARTVAAIDAASR